MDAATAALIGAGVASCVGVGSQFLGHSLGLRRDRQNQRREELRRVIVRAALAIYRADSDFQEDDPIAYPMMTRVSDGITLLQVHFGHDHWLLREYEEAAAVCLEREKEWQEWLRSERDREEQGFELSKEEKTEKLKILMERMHDAQVARDEWMATARSAVDRI